jgi:hypothetical protein
MIKRKRQRDLQEEFGDTKGVIRIRKWKKDRQCNDQNEKGQKGDQ